MLLREIIFNGQLRFAENPMILRDQHGRKLFERKVRLSGAHAAFNKVRSHMVPSRTTSYSRRALHLLLSLSFIGRLTDCFLDVWAF
jgi:hypothetical protein